MFRTILKRITSALFLASFVGLAGLEVFLFREFGDNMKTPYQIYEAILAGSILVFGFIDMYLGGVTAGGYSKK